MVCEITPEMVEKFFGGEDDEFVCVLGTRIVDGHRKIVLELQGEPFDVESAEIAASFATALFAGFSVMVTGAFGLKPPDGLPLKTLTAASAKFAEAATARLQLAHKQFLKNL